MDYWNISGLFRIYLALTKQADGQEKEKKKCF